MTDPSHEQPGGDLIPYTFPDGRKGLIDQRTLDYLQSKAPRPTQSSLDALLDRVVRLRVVAPMDGEVVAEVSAPDAIRDLRPCLAIDEQAEMGHCMCIGDPHLALYDGAANAPIATIGVHHGFSIRWSAWKDDARLGNGMLLLRWLERYGAPEALRSFEEDARRAEEDRRAWERWRDACPRALRPLLEQMLENEQPGGWVVMEPTTGSGRDQPGPGWLPEAESALAEALPDESARADALFEWYGHGTRWSGYPSYEALPEVFLSRIDPHAAVRALVRPSSTVAIEGAARFFSSRRAAARHLPDEVRELLLRHALASADEDRVTRAGHTLLDGVNDKTLRASIEAEIRAFRTARAREHTPRVSTSLDRLREIAAGLGHHGHGSSIELWPEDVLDELEHSVRRLWACACVERALRCFEDVYAGDLRPRRAIEVARRFVRGEADVVDLEKAWVAARDASMDTVRGMRAAEAAKDAVRRRREGRASNLCSAAMAASDTPRSYPSDFLDAAHSAEDAVVGFDLGLDGGRFPNYGGRPTDPARLAERSWQRQRLAELVAQELDRREARGAP